jgi:GTP 3',8-cyclase
MIIRPYIEYYVTLHCNLKCANCSVGSPFIDEWFSDYDSFVRDVEQLSKHIHAGVFRIIGGEPTLNPDIIKYLKYVKQSSIADKTAVATNGINLISQPKEFWEYCDIIHLSMYKNTSINYDKILNFLDSNGYRYMIVTDTGELKIAKIATKVPTNNPDRNNEFRVLDQYTEHSPEESQKVYSACDMHHWCHTFKDGKYYRCSHSLHKNRYYTSIGVPLPYDFLETDGINIDENFEETFNSHENSKIITMDVCRFCKGYGIEGINEPHRQMSKQEIESKKVAKVV